MNNKADSTQTGTIGHVLLAPYREILAHRKALTASVMQVTRARYAGSVLGLAWLVIGPCILLGLYAILYSFIFRVKPINLSLIDYIFYIFSGLVPFIAFGQALSAGTISLSNDRALLLNLIFPAELIPAREVFSAGTFLLVGGGIILCSKVLMGEVYLAWLLLPAIVGLLTMMTLGLVWGLSLANLVLKDTQQMVGYIVIILLISSPIAYTPDMVPAAFQILLYVNPFAYYVQAFQSILVLGQVPAWPILIGCVCFAVLSFHGFFHFFTIGKRIIADHI